LKLQGSRWSLPAPTFKIRLWRWKQFQHSGLMPIDENLILAHLNPPTSPMPIKLLARRLSICLLRSPTYRPIHQRENQCNGDESNFASLQAINLLSPLPKFLSAQASGFIKVCGKLPSKEQAKVRRKAKHNDANRGFGKAGKHSPDRVSLKAKAPNRQR
jgi:hypothetical protein